MVTSRNRSPLVFDREAMGCLEVESIARGVVALDQMAKRAATTIVAARTLSTGRYLVLLSSSVAEVEEAVAAGANAAGDDLLDHLILRDPAEGLRQALASRGRPAFEESLAIVETSTISALLAVSDRALKSLDVRILELRLGAGLSGRGVLTLTGPLHMIQATAEVVEEAVGSDRVVRVELVAQPHPDLPVHLLEPEPSNPRGLT